MKNVLFKEFAFSIGKVFSITWCAALEDFENCFSKMFFQSTGKVNCELELKEKKHFLNHFKMKQSYLYKEKMQLLKAI